MTSETCDHHFYIPAESQHGPAKIELSFRFVDRSTATGVLNLRVDQSRVQMELPFTCLAFDLCEFRAQLRDVYRNLTGSAKLRNFSESFNLAIAVAKPRTMQVSISGAMTFGTPAAVGQSATGLAVSFYGFHFDQTFLPPILRELDLALAEPGLKVSSPWNE